MLARLPYLFTVAGFLKGHRVPEAYVFGGWLEADIEETTAHDAPVAFAWDGADGQPRSEVRWHDGLAWTRASAGGATGPDIDVMDLRRLGDPGQYDGSLHGCLTEYAAATEQDYSSLYWFLKAGPVGTYEPDRFREILHNGIREAEDAAAERCRRLLSIDGQLWIQGGEPYYGVTPSSQAQVTVHQGLVPGNASALYNQFFRADRLEDALAAARAAHGMDIDAGINLPSSIDVLLPEALAFDDDGEHLVRSARQALTSGFETLARGPTERIHAWAALRDAVNEPEDLETLAQLLLRYSETFHETSFTRRLSEQAVRRWDIRPIDADAFSP